MFGVQVSKFEAIFDRKTEQKTAENGGGKNRIEREVSLGIDTVGVERLGEVLIG